MERRKFIQICAVGASAGGCMGAGDAAASTAASLSAAPPTPIKTGVVLTRKEYARVKLVDRDGLAIKAKSLKPNHNYVFHYPFESTPCFLLNLDRALTDKVELLTAKGDSYTWLGGVGPKKNIVAYSAICAHKLAYPSPQVSFISYRDKPSPLNTTGKVIGCCSDKSVYDPFRGAKVISGPAPQPLATILIEHDAKTDELFVIGTFGGEKFTEFFKLYEFKLSLETGGSRAKQQVSKTSVLRDLAAHSAQTATC